MKKDGSLYQFLPPLWLPLFYFTFSVLCFGLALLGSLRYAHDFTQFYYHPRILAFTHLITLGWVTAHILGTFYILGPMSLHMRVAAGILDYLAFLFFSLGLAGMVSHFWISEHFGMAYSAAAVYAGIGLASWNFFQSLRKAKIPGFVRMHVVFAFTNILIAGGWGLLIAMNKLYGFLPTGVTENIFAHAHLAAIGWAMMMVFGMGYRLLPMFLPAEPPKGKAPLVSGILLESGALGLFFSFLLQKRLQLFFAGLIFIAILLFLFTALKMLRRRKPAPPPVPPRPDFSLLHAPAAFFWLIFTAIIGIALIFLPTTQATLPLALAYGFSGIVGFLGQIITGLKPKILAVFTWYHAFSRRGATASIPRPVDMPLRFLQASIFLMWLTGVPFFIAGILLLRQFFIIAGACLLLAALFVSTIHEIHILLTIWRAPLNDSTHSTDSTR